MKPTREQILNEPAGRQMDAWVAEFVMGYEIKGDVILFPDGDYSYLVPDLGGHWTPSQDIAAAWEVMEKLKVRYEIFLYIGMGINRCDITEDENPDPDETHTIRFVSSVIETTMPLAICRAALLAVIEKG